MTSPKQRAASELPSRTPDEWLIKDFNVLYRVTHDLLIAVGSADEPTVARALNAVASQLDRLRPAFTLTEEVRAAARGSLPRGVEVRDATDEEQREALDRALSNYEATKKAGEGD